MPWSLSQIHRGVYTIRRESLQSRGYPVLVLITPNYFSVIYQFYMEPSILEDIDNWDGMKKYTVNSHNAYTSS